MDARVEVLHNGLDYMVSTYFGSTRATQIMTNSKQAAMQELSLKLDLIAGLAKGKTLVATLGQH